MTRFGDPVMNSVVDLHEKGYKFSTIAEALGIPLYRVKAIVSASKEGDDTLKRIAEMKKRGMTDSDIARAIGKSKQYVSRVVGVRRNVHSDKQNYQITIDRGLWNKLMMMAEEFALIAENGRHAGRGSVTKMLEQIALGNLTVTKDRSF